MTAPLDRLEIVNLSKTFGSTRALNEVEFTVRAGELHGLAGQNGSGKSTLIKILTGIHGPDSGASYRVDGVQMHLPVRARDLKAAGVSVVHQDLGLLDELSIAENVCVGGFPATRFGRIKRVERDRLTRQTLARFGVDLDPRRTVGTLSAAERAEVAIARAMRHHAEGSGLVILDESTRALSGDDITRVHALLRRIVATGSAVVLISHNLPEILEISDRVTVLRDGRVVASGLVSAELSEHELARQMLGSTLTALASRPHSAVPGPKPGGVPAVAVHDLTGRRVRNVSFTAERGEVVGITGLPGNGYEDIPYLIAGVTAAVDGELRVGDTTLRLTRASVRSCIKAGVVLVPERRDRDGLAFDLPVRDNISLPALRVRGRPWFVARAWQRQVADAAATRLSIQPADPRLMVKQLSGGNQQKVLLAKWLNMAPTVLVMHEPTQAVDVGARRDILRAVRDSATSGAVVILVSSEPEDLAASCDRVLLYRPGIGLQESKILSARGLIDEIYEPTNHEGNPS